MLLFLCQGGINVSKKNGTLYSHRYLENEWPYICGINLDVSYSDGNIWQYFYSKWNVLYT